MKIEEFLEKKEQIQIELLRMLVLEGGSASINELRSHVKLSKSAFDQYIDDIEMIGRMMKTKISVRKNEFQVVLDLDEQTSLEKIMLFLVQQSVKYQILTYLLEHQQASSVRLATAFTISESSVFRKIKELNHLLKEFSLQIKNGQIQGEELQIRYFYYSLFQFFPESQRPQYLQDTPDKRPLTVGLAHVLNTSFSPQSSIKIATWIGITRKRLLSDKMKFQATKEKKDLYQNDQLYQTIHPVISLYLSRTAADVTAYESMLFYSFLVSFSVLEEETFYQYDLTRSKKLPTAVLDTYIRETMLWHYRPRRLKIKEEKTIGYHLAQINNELYFFSGYLTIYDQQHLLTQQQRMLGDSLSQLLDRLKTTTIEQLPMKKLTDQVLDNLMSQYANILMMIDFYIEKSVVIGIDLQSLPIYRIAFQQFLIRELKGISGIVIEEVQPEKSYDFVITFNQEKKGQEYYYLSEFASSYDISRLKRKIERDKKAKN